MAKSRAHLMSAQGEVLSFKSYQPAVGVAGGKAHHYLLSIDSASAAHVLEGLMPLLGRLLHEKTALVREQRLEQMVDFMAGQLLAPTREDMQMAQRLAQRHARVLNEFGYYTAEQLADANGSQASVRTVLTDNWRKRRMVFAVRHPDAAHGVRDVYPAFQFDGSKPIKAVQAVLAVLGERKGDWKLALWFTSNNGLLPEQARPVDLLGTHPELVIEAAQRDAGGSAA